MMKKLLTLLTVLTLLTFSLCGCGGGGDSGGGQGSTDGVKTLTFGCQNYGGGGIDPASQVNCAWNAMRYGVTECLFYFNDEMGVEYKLCDEYTVNDDHTEWVFHIRDGVKFSDGCDLTPEAVVASFERLFRDGANGSSDPGKFLEEDATLIADNAAGTVTVKTSQPYVDLTKNLAYPVMAIVDTEHTTDYLHGTIGTGPYVATNFREEVGYTMVANENYWDGEVPYDTIELLYMGDASAKAMALQSGQLDLAENITNITDIQKLQDDPNFTVTIANGVRVGIASMNQSEGRPLANDALRHAVLTALDDETMCNVTVGGLYTSGFSVLPSNLDYGYENLTDPDQFNKEKAISMLDAAGITDSDGDGWRELDGKKITLDYVTYPNRCLDDFAQAIQTQLAAVGIDVNLIISDSDTQWNTYVNGEYDLNGSNWTTVGTGDPTEFLACWASQSGADYCGYQNDEYDALYARLLTEFDEDARKDIIQRMQQILIDDAAVVVHGYYNSSMISRNATVGGAAIHTADYYWLTTEIYPAN